MCPKHHFGFDVVLRMHDYARELLTSQDRGYVAMNITRLSAIATLLFVTLIHSGCGSDGDDGATAGSTGADVMSDGGSSDTVEGSDTLSDTDIGADTATGTDGIEDTLEPTEPEVSETADATPSVDLSEPPPAGPGKLLVDPESYQFSYISPQEAMLTKQIAIFNGGTGPLTITSVSMAPGSSPEFGLIGVPPPNLKLNPGKSTLTIARFLDNPQVGGDATIVITSDDPEAPEVQVELTSFLKASLPVPCAQLSPSSLNFGNVIRGETKTLTAELKNCSADKPLSLTEITRSAGFFGSLSEEFQVNPEPTTPLEILPGGTLPIEVSYTPLLAGPDWGHFVVHTDDPETPTQQLDVSGVGIAPPLEQLGLSVRLSWDTDNTDVDSHLIEPNGTLFDCNTDYYYGNPSPDWGTAGDWVDDPFLDLDDVDGYGPENINITEPQPGTYKYTVHYYDDTWEGSFPQGSNATVEVFNLGTKIAEFGPTYLDATNKTWDVFTIEWPSMNITELNSFYQASGGGFCPGSLWP